VKKRKYKLTSTNYKGKGVLGEWRYSSTHYLISALDGGEWSATLLRQFNPQGKIPWYPPDKGLGGPQSRSGRVDEKNSQPLPGIEPPIIQPVAQRYTLELSWLLLTITAEAYSLLYKPKLWK
jgi:hypothetical protein